MMIQGKKWKKDYSKMERSELIKEYCKYVDLYKMYGAKHGRLIDNNASEARKRLCKHRIAHYKAVCEEIEFYLNLEA